MNPDTQGTTRHIHSTFLKVLNQQTPHGKNKKYHIKN